MADEKQAHHAPAESTLRQLPDKPKFVLAQEKLPDLNKYTLRSEGDIKKIETAFNTFEKILNQRKEECLRFAHEAVATYTNAKKKKGGGKNVKSPKKGGGNDTGIKVEYLVLNVENMKNQLSKIGTELGEIEYNLYREQVNLVGKAREYTYFEDYNNKATKLLNEEESTLSVENKKLSDMKAAYKAELKTVLPPLAKANKQLKELSKNELDEFRNLRQPARIVISVVKCVSMMVGTITNTNEKHYREWKDVKKLVKPELIEKMMSFDYDIKNDNHKTYRDIIEEKWILKKDITYERAKQGNIVAGKLMLWLRATIDLSKIKEKVAPQEIEIDTFAKLLKKNEKTAEKLQGLIDENSKHLGKIHNSQTQVIRAINGLRDDITTCLKNNAAAAAAEAEKTKI